ncbi:MAG: peptide deformylase [Acidobacteriota bacterium]
MSETRMAIRRIVKFGDPVLSTPTETITEITGEIRDLVGDMVETMYAAPGVGLAANQIGLSLRLAVIDVTAGQEPGRLITLINPTIIEQEGRQVEEEGCLSVPGFTEFVVRPARAVVKALDIDGKELVMEGRELLARAFCHEIDHLDGKLFLDRLGGIKRQLMLKRVKRATRNGAWDDVYP